MCIHLKFKTVVYIINRHVASFFKKGGQGRQPWDLTSQKLKISRKDLYFMAGCYALLITHIIQAWAKIKIWQIENKHFEKSWDVFVFFYSSWIFIAKYIQNSFSSYFPIISIQMDLPRDTSIQITFHELLENGQNLICYKRGVVNH